MATQATSIRPPLQPVVPHSEEERLAVETLDQYAERLAMRFSIGAGIVTLLAVIAFNWGDGVVPLMRDRQGFGILTLYLAPLCAAVSCAITYMLGQRAFNKRVAPELRRRYPSAGIVIGLGYAVVTAFLIALALQLAEIAFTGLELAMLQGAAIAAGTAGALTQMFARRAARMSTTSVLQLTLLVIAAGVYITAALIDNPEWWRISFSYLGGLESNSSRVFNTTLVFGGLLILSWLPYLLTDVRVLVKHGVAAPFALRYFGIGMVWLAIGIALVGLFKTQATPFSSLVHNLSAYSLAALFGIFFVFFKRAMPGVSRELMSLTFVLIGGLAVTLLLAAIGYFNTVGLEVICFVLGLAWLQSMASFIHSEAMRLEPTHYPE